MENGLVKGDRVVLRVGRGEFRGEVVVAGKRLVTIEYEGPKGTRRVDRDFRKVQKVAA